MESKIAELVTGQGVFEWLIVAFLVGYFVYKEWPSFRQRVSKGEVKEIHDKTIEERLDEIDSRLGRMEERLDRDYSRLNSMEVEQTKMREDAADSLQEREIIMRTLLSVLDGLQELGANGSTKESKDEINQYLNKQAHK